MFKFHWNRQSNSLLRFAAVAWLVVLSSFGIIRADEFPLAKGFPNYYFNEPSGVDWANNCRVIADVQTGTTLPMTLSIAFRFQWNTVDGQGNAESVFRRYSRGTWFDLVTDTGGGFAYTQSNAVRPRLSGQSTATVQFNSITLNAPAGGESRTPFEIYGDCDTCAINQEANPSQFDKRTTWRIFGVIRVKAKPNGELDDWSIEELDSETPDKLLDRWGNQHQAEWYPARQLARRTNFLAFSPPTHDYPNVTHVNCPPSRSCCRRSCCWNFSRRINVPCKFRRRCR